MNSVVSACKRELLELYHHALDSVKPEKLIRQSVTISDCKLTVTNPVTAHAPPLTYDLEGSRIHVIGGGKCVLGMARGLAQLARATSNTHLFSYGCLSLPENLATSHDSITDELLKSVGITCKFGSKNNLPDENSAEATKRILECVDKASSSDVADGLESLFVVLLSGGGSACLTSPKHVTLKQKLGIIDGLVKKGADIKELNAVRRRLSGVKGGHLASHILRNNPRSRILSLIISDVVGDPLEFIASGPTCRGNDEPHGTTFETVCRKYDLLRDLPAEAAKLGLGDDNAPDETSICNVILGNNTVALGAFASRAHEMGYDVLPVPGDSLAGKTWEILEIMLDRARNNVPGPGVKQLIVYGGESTVALEEGGTWGLGGRAQEMALQYLLMSQPDGHLVDLFFAGSTDGQDGPTDVAGCFASACQMDESKCFSVCDVARAKKSHDANTFWVRNKPDWLVKTGPTGTNVMDLYALVRVPRDPRDSACLGIPRDVHRIDSSS